MECGGLPSLFFHPRPHVARDSLAALTNASPPEKRELTSALQNASGNFLNAARARREPSFDYLEVHGPVRRMILGAVNRLHHQAIGSRFQAI
jgi:hypothetical protein